MIATVDDETRIYMMVMGEDCERQVYGVTGIAPQNVLGKYFIRRESAEPSAATSSRMNLSTNMAVGIAMGTASALASNERAVEQWCSSWRSERIEYSACNSVAMINVSGRDRRLPDGQVSRIKAVVEAGQQSQSHYCDGAKRLIRPNLRLDVKGIKHGALSIVASTHRRSLRSMHVLRVSRQDHDYVFNGLLELSFLPVLLGAP